MGTDEPYEGILRRYMDEVNSNNASYASVAAYGSGTAVNAEDVYNRIMPHISSMSSAYAVTKSLSEYNADRIDELERILRDICDLLALLYDSDGPRSYSDMTGIRSFIDSIKVIEEGGNV